MNITATSIFFSEAGKPMEQHQLQVEFNGENDLPGEGALGISGRACEIEAVSRGLMNAIREEIENQ